MTLALRARPAIGAVPALVGATVLAQVGYPLTSGSWRDTLTVLIVGLAATAAFAHAATTRGPRMAVVLAGATVLGGFVVEVIGVRTGYPFGRYVYSATLGTRLLGVPIVIAFAWTMLAWPAALAARRLCRGLAARVLVGAWALASWDVFLDPQMVAAGHWRWLDPRLHLPGVPSVPIGDYLGWLGCALVVSLILQAQLRSSDGESGDEWPLAFYVWTWASSTLALAVFLDLPAAALWGALAMGVIAVPLTIRLLNGVFSEPAR